jgi:hypothetical protein
VTLSAASQALPGHLLPLTATAPTFPKALKGGQSDFVTQIADTL